MCRLGIPIGIQFFLEFGVFGAIGILMGTLGTIPMASHQVAINLASLTFMMAVGVTQATTVLVGQAEGDKDDSLHGILDGGLWAAPSATLIASGTSLYFGGRRARACHKAQREMRGKIEAEQRALELHPSK